MLADTNHKGKQAVEAPTFCRQSAHIQWPVALYPHEDTSYSLPLEAKWNPRPQCPWED
jgi:hypothetical protein